MKRGRPFEPGNKFGRGRPKGSPNKKKPLAQKILDENAPAIMALAINTAREDDKMLRTLIRELGRALIYLRNPQFGGRLGIVGGAA